VKPRIEASAFALAVSITASRAVCRASSIVPVGSVEALAVIYSKGTQVALSPRQHCGAASASAIAWLRRKHPKI